MKKKMFLGLVVMVILVSVLNEARAKVAAYWKLDESSGSVASDASGFAHDGSLINGPTWNPSGGQFGGALEFDGADDYVNNSFAVDRTAFTIVHWLKPLDVASRAGAAAYYESNGSSAQYNGFDDDNILEWHTGIARPSEGAGWAFFYEDGTRGQGLAGGWMYLTGGTVTEGVWTHVAVTFDLNSAAILYVNGEEVAQLDLTGNGFQGKASTVHQLGAVGYLQQSNRFWKGAMDEVAVFDEVLTKSEIQTIMVNGVPEPMTICLLALGACAIRRRNRT